MSTTVKITHVIEYPLTLVRDDPEEFARGMVRIYALQALCRAYPCTSTTDDLQITVATARTTDPFGRITLTGTATAPCGKPRDCAKTYGVVLP
ncbi:hypothetical protein QFZ75_007933 [Streptomyces sp. V3I8]|uniref:hypothetical protein n=1 Tax=Streptomyces sp. V3I8 TaxID=3042279 RepID=UPI00277F793B|nr:hypothetical protein [Streptomyces sp. V3I8]MDQ1041431.1 hypothetical protein [Streptomyces sp. V3I8]